MFKSHELVVNLKKKPKNEETNRYPLVVVDNLTIREVAQDIVTAYAMIKGFKTLCGMAEHIVVTKVK